MNRSCKFILFGFSFAVACFASQAQSQLSTSSAFNASVEQRSTANYIFAKPAELTITVDVVGMVQRPGRYEISSSINLINLVALAGGGSMDAALDDVKITRVVEAEGKIRLDVKHVNLEDLSKVRRADLVLFPGDVIQIEKSGWSSFRESFNIIVGTAIITGAVAQLIYATKR